MAKSFISQLKDIQKDFINYCKSNSYKIDKKTLTYRICNGYIELTVEGMDKDYLYVKFIGFLRTDNNSIYQSEIGKKGIFIQRP